MPSSEGKPAVFSEELAKILDCSVVALIETTLSSDKIANEVRFSFGR